MRIVRHKTVQDVKFHRLSMIHVNEETGFRKISHNIPRIMVSDSSREVSLIPDMASNALPILLTGLSHPDIQVEMVHIIPPLNTVRGCLLK